MIPEGRSGLIFLHEIQVGRIFESESSFVFQYHSAYLDEPDAQPISFSFPLRSEPYSSPTFFPFFDGLIPEGWLLQIAVRNWKLSERDRMGLLLALCADCIGAVSVIEGSK